MVKYTHITERCSGFLKTGVSWRLKRHGYTFAEAYWRLRDGKGLISATDRIALATWSGLITDIRQAGIPVRLNASQDIETRRLRKELLERMEQYRDYLEYGMQPVYLYMDSHPSIAETLLYRKVCTKGNPVEWTPEMQQDVWESLDMERLRNEIQAETLVWKTYQQDYEASTPAHRKSLLHPDEWLRFTYKDTFKKDKLWMIRAGHDHRCSIGADIDKRLSLLWDVPSRVDSTQRYTFQKNRLLIDEYVQWKKQVVDKGMQATPEVATRRFCKIMNGFVVPEEK